MFRFVVVLFLLFSSIVTYGQTYLSEDYMTALFWEAQSNMLPQKAKMKTVKLGKVYTMSCYFLHDLPISGQMVKIQTKDGDSFLEGLLSNDKGVYFVDGCYQYEDNGKFEQKYGLFKIHNAPGDLLTFNKRKTALFIDEEKILIYHGYVNGLPCMIRQKSDNWIMSIDDTNNLRYEQIEITLPHQIVDAIGYSNFQDLLSSGPYSAIVKTKDHTAFTGRANYIQNLQGDIVFDFYEGEKVYASGKTISTNMNGVSITHPTQDIDSLTFSYKDDFVPDRDSLWNEAYYVRNSDVVSIVYSNGDQFKGAFRIGTDGRPVPQEGEYRHASGKTISTNMNGVSVTHPTQDIDSLTFSYKDDFVPDRDSLWNEAYYVRNSDVVSIVYSNGDQFKGAFRIGTDGRLVPRKGEYRYASGDKFVGNYSENQFAGIPLSGETTFKYGSKKTGNWIRDYNLTDAQYVSLSKEHFDSPSELLTEILQQAKTNLYNDYILQARKYEEQQDYEAALNSYEKAQSLNHKVDLSDKIRELNDELKIKQEREKRLNELTAKYGRRNAEKLLNGIVELGMTKEMVSEVLSPDYYDISQRMSFGKKIEEWTFNSSKAVYSSTNDNIVLGALYLYADIETFGLLSSVGNNLTDYRYLEFTNSILTRIDN